MSRVGQRHGLLVITADAGRSVSRYRVYRVACDCGREEEVAAYRLQRIDRCSACRTPSCRVCGVSLGGPTRRRTCSPECRRALNAVLARESYVRGGDGARERACQYNRDRQAALDAATRATELERKRAQDRRRHRELSDDPAWRESERRRKAAYETARSSDPTWREKQAAKMRKQRAEQEAAAMLRDLQSIAERADDE